MSKPTFRIPTSQGLTAPAEIMMAIEQAMGSFFHRVREIETSVLHLLAKPPGVIGKEAGSPAVQTTQRVDERSEKVIATLLPEVQPYARSLIIKAAAAGIIIKVISGLRTYAEQDKLYAQGRSTPGKIVTKAKAGHSNHNFGIAFDIGVFKGGKYLPESPDYRKVGAIGAGIGLDWGGNWKSFEDQPHFELHPKWAASLSEEQMLKELRERKDSGKALFI